MDKDNRDDKNPILFLEYDNSPEVLCPSLKETDSFLSINSILSNDLLSFELSNNQITGDGFNSIWDIDFINGWNKTDKDLWAYDREWYLKEMKKGVKFYYLGKTKLSNKYDSYVILQQIEDPDDELSQRYFAYRNMYLFNVRKHEVVSI